jgi:tRNA(fMet)-specific endonuclease VapC
MNPLFLLDTNVVSEPLRAAPRPGVLQKLSRHRAQLAIASVVWHELWFGAKRLPPSRHRDTIERYLNENILEMMPILNYTSAAAEWHAHERARLVARGQTPPHLDGQIAAITAVNDLTLVTFNVAHFNRFEGVRVESWW